MALQRITVRTSTAQRQTTSRVSLDGVRYRLRFRYVLELDRWLLDVEAEAGTLLVAGIVLVLGVDLLGQYRHLAVPQGQLFAIDTTTPDLPTDPRWVDPGLDGFDSRVLLVYRPAAEVVG